MRMRSARRRIVAMVRAGLVVAIAAAGLAAMEPPARVPITFEGPVKACTMHNPSGPIFVETWQQGSVWVEVTKADGSEAGAERLKSEMGQDAELMLWTSPEANETLMMRVKAPASARLTVRGGSGDVEVRGLANALNVETTSGAIRVYAAPNAGADVSLRSRAGTVLAAMQVNAGTSEPGVVEGKLGGGGAPVMLRSLSGRIELLREDAAKAGREPVMRTPARPQPGSPDFRQVIRDPNISGILAERAAAVRAERESGSLAALKKKREEAKLVEASSGARIRSQSRLVLLNVSAVDAGMRRVTNLHKEDFAVMENGAEQQIAVFEPVAAPLQVFLLLDLSGSTAKHMGIVRDASKKFTEALQPQDEVAVAGFTNQFMLASHFTSDRKLLKKRIGDIHNRGGGTYFYKSLWNALDVVAEAKGTRRAIVVMTDGVDNLLSQRLDQAAAEKDFEALKERLGGEDVTIFPVYLNTEYEMVVKQGAPTGQDSISYQRAREQLAEIAALTGGEMFRAERVEDLTAAFTQAVAALRSFYTLGYYPPRREGDAGEWRNVKVQVGQGEVKARTRSGYFVP